MTRRETPLQTWGATEADVRRTRIYYLWMLLVIAFEYMRPGAFLPVVEAVKLNTLIPLGLFAAVLVAPGLRPFKVILADRTTKWMLLFMGLIVVSVPLVEVTFYALDIFKKVFAHFTLFLIIARVVTTNERIQGVFGVLVASHMFALVMNPDVVLNPQVRSYIRGAPFLGDGNDFALSLCILMPMAIYLAGSARSKLLRAASWAAVLMIILAIIGTQSRGAALAGCAVLGFLWLTSKQKVASMMGIGLVAVIVVAFGSQTYFDRMRTIRDYESESSAHARVVAWKAATRMAVDNPLLGVGAGHFPMAYGGAYRAPEGRGRWMTAHSMYFLVLAELGLPGITAYGALVFGGIWSALAVRRRLLGASRGSPRDAAVSHARLLGLLATSVIGFAVAGAFLSVTYYVHVFVLSGLLIAARAVALYSMAAPSQVSASSGEDARIRRRGLERTRPGFPKTEHERVLNSRARPCS